MSNRLYGILFLSLLVVFASCGGNRKTFVSTDEGDTLTMKYAQRIIIVEHEDYTEVTLKHPWQEGQLLHRYYLVDRNRQELPPVLNHGGTIVRVPLQRAAVFTTVHASLMMNFGRQEAIAAVADSKYMKIPYVQQGISEGRIIDCGDGLSPMVEKIIDAQADAILLSPFENSGGYGRMEEIGIPLIECAEYMETSPLGRAEWMRFYGRLLGCEQKADSLFAVVDSCYHALAQQAGTAQTKPTVLMDKQTGSVWYVPGGRSTIGQLLQDAACHYPFADDEHSGSLPLSFESVLEKAGEADVWLFRYDSDTPLTLSQLLKEQRGYQQLRPVREHHVYGCNVRTSLFYEQSPFRPDYLLQDIIQILHPELHAGDSLRYYQALESK